MFQRPRRIEWEQLGPRFGRMIAEPFEKGYALTVGNSLRRVLLAVIPGAAVTWAKIQGVAANATHVRGVQEDLSAILLNLKKVIVRLPDEKPVTARIEVHGPKSVTTADLGGPGLEVVDPEVPVCTVDAGGTLVMEVGVRMGRGYVSADRHPEPAPTGAISLDAAFSPIQRVNYTVEMSRLGKITDYEKLVLEIWTNGTVAPDHALLRASALLRDHFDLFTPAGAEEEDEDVPGEPVAPGEAQKSS
ncbi:MAG: DNA-directed RNA polymerase subunit alpha [Candidatus Rokubacteria bacterium]|nr:DNA-directed RNA polymerase subunit alpha [Candidatus Rokubacteria bacterium]